MLDSFYQKLQKQHTAGLTRHLTVLDKKVGERAIVNGQSLFHFSSNDYLGFSQHPAIISATIEALKIHGLGSASSPQVAGYHRLHALAEEAIGKVLGLPYITLFTSGYLANQALLQCFADQTTIFCDKHIHASLLDGVRLSDSAFYRFRHQDINHLSHLLTQHANRPRLAPPLIVVEGVYSMDGEIAPLPTLQALSNQYGALLVIDDAHGLGVLGHLGKGSLAHHSIIPTDNLIYMGTLGKAMGCYGAFIGVSNPVLHQMIHQFARAYRYTTALPFHLGAAITKAFQLLIEEPSHHQNLKINIQLWQSLCKAHNISYTDTAIQPWVIGCPYRAVEISQLLVDNGFWVQAMRSPTVPKKNTGLRVGLSAIHQHDTIRKFFHQLLGYSYASISSDPPKNT